MNTLKCPNPNCSFEPPTHQDLPKRRRKSKTARRRTSDRTQKAALSQHLIDNLLTCGRYGYVCSCKTFASDTYSSLRGHISFANASNNSEFERLDNPS